MRLVSSSINWRSIVTQLQRDAKSVRRAAIAGVNNTVFGLRKAEPGRMDNVFDRPRNFTKIGSGVLKMDDSLRPAVFFIKDKQEEYLRIQERGGIAGVRGRQKARSIPVAPVATDKFGGLKRRVVPRLLAKKNVFRVHDGNVAGMPAGVYRRKGKKGKPQLLVRWAMESKYEPRFDFLDNAIRTALHRAPIEIRAELARRIP